MASLYLYHNLYSSGREAVGDFSKSPSPASGEEVRLQHWNPDETVLGMKHIGMLVDDVWVVADRLKDRGVRLIYPPNHAKGGVDTCFFADPDGNALELINGTCVYD